MVNLGRLNAELARLVTQARTGLVQISNGGRGVGAGTVWHPEGLIVSNAHVAGNGRRSITVTLPDGQVLPARLLAREKRSDLAAIAVEANNLPVIEVGRSHSLKPGDLVLAVGHPWGVLGAATMGVVITVDVPLEMPRMRRELIQVSLHLRPGHSGGPLVDVEGKLVGVNTMMAGPDVGMAVPVDEVKRFLKQRLGEVE
jgi:S1-C subfamily serine protease